MPPVEVDVLHELADLLVEPSRTGATGYAATTPSHSDRLVDPCESRVGLCKLTLRARLQWFAVERSLCANIIALCSPVSAVLQTRARVAVRHIYYL